MKNVILLCALSITLTGCETTAGAELKQLMPTLEKAEADYGDCVAILNASEVGLSIADRVNLSNEPEKADLLLLTDRFSAQDVENVVVYNTAEFQCYTKAIQSIDNIDQSRASQITSNYAATLAETHAVLQEPDTFSIGQYNRYMSDITRAREENTSSVAMDKINALSNQDAMVKAERSRKLSGIGQILSNADAQARNSSFGTQCNLVNNVKTGITKQCIYNCLGQTHIVTKDFGICPISITK